MCVGIDFLKGLGRESEGIRRERRNDVLVIDCGGCRLTPLPGSDECIRCMVEAMCSEGGADRIVLRTGRDVEVSGAASRAIREVASIRRWSSTTDRASTRCRTCRLSRENVMAAVWSEFPRNAVFEGRKALKDAQPEREECSECVMRTTRALDQVDAGIRRVVSEMGEVR